MDIVKIRRVGNSNVVTLPRSLEELGYAPGTRVAVEVGPTGEVVLRPVESAREQIRASLRKVVAERRGALDLLTRYDRGEPNPLHPPE